MVNYVSWSIPLSMNPYLSRIIQTLAQKERTHIENFSMENEESQYMYDFETYWVPEDQIPKQVSSSELRDIPMVDDLALTQSFFLESAEMSAQTAMFQAAMKATARASEAEAMEKARVAAAVKASKNAEDVRAAKMAHDSHLALAAKSAMANMAARAAKNAQTMADLDAKNARNARSRASKLANAGARNSLFAQHVLPRLMQSIAQYPDFQSEINAKRQSEMEAAEDCLADLPFLELPPPALKTPNVEMGPPPPPVPPEDW